MEIVRILVIRVFISLYQLDLACSATRFLRTRSDKIHRTGRDYSRVMLHKKRAECFLTLVIIWWGINYERAA